MSTDPSLQVMLAADDYYVFIRCLVVVMVEVYPLIQVKEGVGVSDIET